MTESSFDKLDECPKCGGKTVGRIRYVTENFQEVTVYDCQDCGDFKRTKNLQAKLSKY